MTEMLDWAERAGHEGFCACEKTADIIRQEAATTFGWIIAASAAALSFVLRPEDGDSAFTAAVLALLAIYLAAVGLWLLTRAMQFGDVPSQWNLPLNLYQKQEALLDLREVELENLQLRIKQMSDINRARSDYVNLARKLCALGVIVAGSLVLVPVGYSAFAAAAAG